MQPSNHFAFANYAVLKLILKCETSWQSDLNIALALFSTNPNDLNIYFKI